MPPARVRLLAVLLIVALMSLSAYVGCRQLRNMPTDHRSTDCIEAVERIHAYIQRVEDALRSIDDALSLEEPSADDGG